MGTNLDDLIQKAEEMRKPAAATELSFREGAVEMIKFDVFFPIPQSYHDEGLIRLAISQGAMKVVEVEVETAG